MLNKHTPLISWRTIKQTITRPSLTFYALKRKSKSLLKLLSIGIVMILIGAMVYCLNSCSHSKLAPASLASLRTPIESIQYSTTGNLTKDSILKYTHLDQPTDIMDLNIFELKHFLETIPQVKEALVERAFPNSIKIALLELVPVARIAVRQKASTHPNVLYISKEGIVFESTYYPMYAIKDLPFLTDIRLKKVKSHFEPLMGMDRISDFLNKAAKYKPDLYAQFKTISLKKFDPNSQQSWSIIKVHTHSQQEWIFATHLFLSQLERLEYVLQVLEKTNKRSIERIDLSLKDDVVVEFKDDKPLKNISPKR